MKVLFGPARVWDRMGSSDDTTLWGSSSLFVQVTMVPALTLMAAGMNEKLSMVTAEVATAGWAAAAGASAWAWAAGAACVVAAAALVPACVAPPHAVNPTAASVPIATVRPAGRENGKDMSPPFWAFSGIGPIRGLPPYRYERGLQQARATPAGAAAPRRRRRCGAPGAGPAEAEPCRAGGRAAGPQRRRPCGGTDSPAAPPPRSAEAGTPGGSRRRRRRPGRPPVR